MSKIEQALSEVDEALTPADEQTIGKMLDNLMAGYGIPENWDVVIKHYFIALQDIPHDLLKEAYRRCIKFYSRRPQPADIRRTVSAELARRNTVKLRLQTAQMAAKREERNALVPTGNDAEAY